MITEKRCYHCKRTLPISCFSKDRKQKYGIRANCKECCSEYAKQFHRKTVLTYEYTKNHHENFLLRSAKTRARLQGLPFNLELSDIVIPELCPVLNVKMGYKSNYSPSVDRIVPNLGYTKGNIVIISKKANVMKSNASIVELLQFCKGAQEVYGP